MCLIDVRGETDGKSAGAGACLHRAPCRRVSYGVQLCEKPRRREDICQEVFLALYNTWEKGEKVRHLRAWLLTVTRNRCKNHLRDGLRERPTADDSGVWDIPAADDDALLVKELLGSLPPDERLVFCLHCLDGYGYRELAEGLELPIGTIKTRVHAARRRLKALLHEREETE